MTNFSIPNSTPATGRISRTSSRQSKRSNNDPAIRENIWVPISRTASLLVIRRRMLDVEPTTFSFPSAICDPQSAIGRVKGAWWPSRSSKPSSPRKWRGRFDSYPLRQLKFDVRFLIFDLQSARQFPSTSNFKPQTSKKGVTLMSREQIRKLTSLSSCAG
jgi:hypothetical protein